MEMEVVELPVAATGGGAHGAPPCFDCSICLEPALRPPLLPRLHAPLDALRRPLPRVQGSRVRGPPPPALPRPQRPALLSRPAHSRHRQQQQQPLGG